ncbi:hypothetical protein MMC34_003607, partial [Xylographa carneopallida]|nr:hypothetical protein [Xylographa carneopallida]
NQEGGSAVIQCNADTFCCGGDDCDCNTGQNVITIPGTLDIQTIIPNAAATTTITYTVVTETTPTTATSSTASTNTLSLSSDSLTTSLVVTTTPQQSSFSSIGSASPATATPILSTASASNNAMTIGLGVGIPLGILLIAGIVYLAWFRGRRQHRSPADPNQDLRDSNTEKPKPGAEDRRPYNPTSHASELFSEPSELASGQAQLHAAELPQ